jgi:pimeloyl-ACP methyl ester carboxylesterase
MLELLDKASATESHPVPLLFVHGAWHAAWCWDERFLDFFADRGYRALAMSLRGHGKSPAPKPMQFWGGGVARQRNVCCASGTGRAVKRWSRNTSRRRLMTSTFGCNSRRNGLHSI